MEIIDDLGFKFTCNFGKGFYLYTNLVKAQEVIIEFMG